MIRNPCRRCKSADIVVTYYGPKFYCRCRICGTATKDSKTANGAVRNWNAANPIVANPVKENDSVDISRN